MKNGMRDVTELKLRDLLDSSNMNYLQKVYDE